MIRDMGSFHVGGRTIEIHTNKKRKLYFAKGGVPVTLNENGTYPVEQMYTQYFVPTVVKGKYPIVFIHGGSMSGTIYETTPDGREGWLNYFIRKGWTSYNTD